MNAWFRILLVLALGIAATTAQAGDFRIGAGANYWVVLDDIDTDELDDTGLSYQASVQYMPTLVGVELDVEFLPDYFGDDAYAPQAYLIVGKGIFAGVGVGILNIDDEFADDPFYALKAGITVEFLSVLHIDLYGNYRFNDDSTFEKVKEDIDTDTVFLGATARVSL